MEKTKNIDLLKPLFKKKRVVSQQITKLSIKLDYYYGLIQLRTFEYLTRRKELSEGYYYHAEDVYQKKLDKINKEYLSEYDLKLLEVNSLLKERYWQLRADHEEFKLDNSENAEAIKNNLKNLYKEYDLYKEELESELSKLDKTRSNKNPNEEHQSKLDAAKDEFKSKLIKKVDLDRKTLIKTYQKLLKHEQLITNLGLRIFDDSLINDMILAHKEMIEINTNTYQDLQESRNYIMIGNYHALLSLKHYHKIEKIKADIKTKNQLLKSFDEELNLLISKHEELKETPIIEMQENQDIHLKISGLKMYFGGLKAVDDLNFDIKRGEIFSLIGPNGAGKTTVFNCITQFYKPTGGEVYINNKLGVTKRLNDYKVHDIINQGIARTFQNVELVTELTVFENLLVGSHSLFQTNFLQHMIKSPKARIEEKILQMRAFTILKRLNLTEYMFSYPQGLPYGTLKRVELARALMTNPEIIILDEPAAGLNEIETKELAQLIKELNVEFNLTIFLVEHDMSLVMDISDRICVISFGKMLAIGDPVEIQKNPTVQEAYLGGDRDE